MVKSERLRPPNFNVIRKVWSYVHCQWEGKLRQTFWNRGQQLLLMLKLGTFDSQGLLIDILKNKTTTCINGKNYVKTFIEDLFIIGEIPNATKNRLHLMG